MMTLYLLNDCPDCCELKWLLVDSIGGTNCRNNVKSEMDPQAIEVVKKLCKDEIEGIKTYYFMDGDKARKALDDIGVTDDYTPILIDEEGKVYSEVEDIARMLLPYLV